MLVYLAGAIALLLWGVHMVQSGIPRAFGPHLRRAACGATPRWMISGAALQRQAADNSPPATRRKTFRRGPSPHAKVLMQRASGPAISVSIGTSCRQISSVEVPEKKSFGLDQSDCANRKMRSAYYLIAAYCPK